MLKRTCILLVSVLGLVGVSVAQAASYQTAYIEINPGYSHSIDSSELHRFTGGTHRDLKKSGFGVNGNLGYQFNRYIAAEAGATWFNKVKNTYTKNGQSGKLTIDKNWGFDVAARFTLPLRITGSRRVRAGTLGLFVKGGPALMLETKKAKDGDGTKYSKSTEAFAAAYGGGIEYNITNSIAINSQFNAMTPLSNTNRMAYKTRMLISGGLKLNF